MIQGNKVVSDLTITDKAGEHYFVKGTVQAWGMGGKDYIAGDGLLTFYIYDKGQRIGRFCFLTRADKTVHTSRLELDAAYRNRGIATEIYRFLKTKGLTVLRTQHARTPEAQFLSASLRKKQIVVENRYGD